MDEDPLPPIHPVLNIRPKAPKLCGVCGDISKSQHFGAISCDSCKAFFKRTVHAQNYPHLKCSEKGDCEVQISTRKNCQHCRFKKCLSTGMEISWVMTEEQRKEFNKEMELKKKLKELNKMDFQDETSTSDDSTFNDDFYIPTMENIRLFMTENEESFVKSLVLKYTYSYKKVPYEKNLSSDNDGRPNIQTVDMFTTIIRRFAYFSMLLPEFSNLPRSDQSILLKSGILEMCLLRSALCFDIEKNRWPNTNWDLYADAPTLQLEDMQRLVTPELYEMLLDFIQSMQEMGLDEATCMLILGITLLTPDRPGLTEKAKVSQGQDKFIDHLEKYVRWRYGPTRGPIIFPKLVTKLADLRELSDSHNEYNLRLAKEEVNVIKKSLASLNLEEDNDLMTQAISSPIVATSPANTIMENHGYETSPEIHPNLQQEQEMEGRKETIDDNNPKIFNTNPKQFRCDGYRISNRGFQLESRFKTLSK